MKKLMIAASVALCATVGFSDVTSANVVGYTKAALLQDGGAKITGASFFDIKEGGDLKLGDIKITGYEDETAEVQDFWSGVVAQTLTPGGATKDVYNWWDGWDYDDATGEIPTFHWYGWYTDDAETYEDDSNDVEIKAGNGLWVFSQSTDYKIQSSGEVPPTTVKVGLLSDGGAMMVGNPMPTNLTLGDFVVKGYEDETAEVQDFWSGVVAQTLTPGGATKDIYNWWDGWDYDDATGEIPTFHWYGWYTDEAETYADDSNDVEVPQGSGLWVFSQSTDYSINIAPIKL